MNQELFSIFEFITFFSCCLSLNIFFLFLSHCFLLFNITYCSYQSYFSYCVLHFLITCNNLFLIYHIFPLIVILFILLIILFSLTYYHIASSYLCLSDSNVLSYLHMRFLSYLSSHCFVLPPYALLCLASLHIALSYLPTRCSILPPYALLCLASLSIVLSYLSTHCFLLSIINHIVSSYPSSPFFPIPIFLLSYLSSHFFLSVNVSFSL